MNSHDPSQELFQRRHQAQRHSDSNPTTCQSSGRRMSKRSHRRRLMREESLWTRMVAFFSTLLFPPATQRYSDLARMTDKSRTCGLDLTILKEEEIMSRSANRDVTVYHSTKLGSVPGHVQLAQRHLEKERPPIGPGPEQTFLVPAELIDLASDLDQSKDITEFSVTYQKGSGK